MKKGKLYTATKDLRLWVYRGMGDITVPQGQPILYLGKEVKIYKRRGHKDYHRTFYRFLVSNKGIYESASRANLKVVVENV